MSGLNLIIVLAVLLSGVLFWLLIPHRKRSEKGVPDLPKGTDALPGPRHYAYFPQIRQALSRGDSEYLLRNAPRPVAKRALRERRAIARRFLRGLNEDFSALAKLGRTIAALSPQVSHQQETKRLILTARFQVTYALVWLRLWSGALPLDQLEVLAGLVGRLAIRIDAAMAEVNALSTRQLEGKLSA